MKYIIVTALADEAHGLERFAPVIITGIGKVNACIKLYEAVIKYQPQLVINYGTAGAITDLIGLHRIDHFVQIDMDVRALDFPRGVTPLSGESLPEKHGLVLGTGDSFITDVEKQLEGLAIDVDLVDMEAYALNQVCEHHGVNFEAYKFVSDNADATAGVEWKNTVKDGTHVFVELLINKFGFSELLD